MRFLWVFAILFCAGWRVEPDSAQELDPLEMNDEMRQFLDENVDRTLPQLDRLERLVSVVFQENKLGFIYSKETKSAVRTFTERSGNCLSFTNMFLVMARYVGLNVSYREVVIPPSWTMRGQAIFLSRHVNVEAKIGVRTFVVDLFPQVNRVEIGGETVSDERGRAHFYNNKGAESLAGGDSNKAIEWYQRAIQLDPAVGFVWANLGVAHASLGQYETAEKAYLKSLEIERGNLAALSNLAALYTKTGRAREAAAYNRRVEEFRQKNPYYHYSLGEQAAKVGSLDESVRHFKEALKRKPKESRFHFAIAQVYVRLGELDSALRHLEKAKEYAPDESGRLRYSHKLELLADLYDQAVPMDN